jgi:PhzF family phenazine biosynthesis protein
MKHKIFQVDAFTNKAFSGNPACVVLLERGQPDSWMQSVASEMNLSETAFISGRTSPFDLRWFTPAVEVDLCGHATLATAHILYETEIAAKDERIDFNTRGGLLNTTYKDGWIEMDFPSFPTIAIKDKARIAKALKHTPTEVYTSSESIMAVFEDPEIIYHMAPDLELIKALKNQGIMVTSLSDENDIDFISRYFAPYVGIDEDPVTGSAHSSLGPYWGNRLNKQILTAKQVSARGGDLRIKLKDDRVLICGQAVTIFSGILDA